MKWYSSAVQGSRGVSAWPDPLGVQYVCHPAACGACSHAVLELGASLALQFTIYWQCDLAPPAAQLTAHSRVWLDSVTVVRAVMPGMARSQAAGPAQMTQQLSELVDDLTGADVPGGGCFRDLKGYSLLPVAANVK